MKQILVYENWLRAAPTRIGTLFVEGARGKEVCSFEYDNEWLKHSGSFMLDPDLSLFKGRQFVPVGKELFGIFEDSCPDRWGRTLMDRRESIIARSESRKPRKLMESDMAAPPWVALRKLNDAVAAFESDTTHSDKWLQMLIAPGSSLGGARPKANVIAPDGSLWIAKFPSKNDKINCGAWEKTVYMFVLCEDPVIPAGTRIVDAVAEPADAVVHGDHHLFQQAISSIVVTKIFHDNTSP